MDIIDNRIVLLSGISSVKLEFSNRYKYDCGANLKN